MSTCCELFTVIAATLVPAVLEVPAVVLLQVPVVVLPESVVVVVPELPERSARTVRILLVS